MAFNKAPTAVVPSWSIAGNVVSFDITDLSNALTAAHANPTTGDSREVIFSLLDHFYNYYKNLPTADKPAQMTISKSGSLQADETYQLSLSMAVKTSVSEYNIVDEAV